MNKNMKKKKVKNMKRLVWALSHVISRRQFYMGMGTLLCMYVII